MWLIRKAEPADAATLASLAERTFRATFGAANVPANIDLHCARSYGIAAQAREIANPRMATRVCEQDGTLIGYAQLRWGAAPECVVAECPAEIQRIYVEAGWHGGGVAQALMAGMLEIARAGDADCIWLGVWELDPRARALYEKCGFTTAGDHEFPAMVDRLIRCCCADEVIR